MKQKTVLITGGNRGLGRAKALALAEEGHRVAVTGRDKTMLEETATNLPGGLALQACVTDVDRAKQVIGEVEQKLGPIDVLINNAGVLGKGGPFWETPIEELWATQEINLKGPLVYSHTVLQGMLKRGTGIIINVGSYTSMRPNAINPAYATSKTALARFSDSLAAQVKEKGIQVFCVSPGLVRTDMTNDVEAFKSIPDDRWNQPEDMSELVCKLTTGEYGALSGRFFHVKDDLDAMMENLDKIEQEWLYEFRMSNLNGVIE